MKAALILALLPCAAFAQKWEKTPDLPGYAPDRVIVEFAKTQEEAATRCGRHPHDRTVGGCTWRLSEGAVIILAPGATRCNLDHELAHAGFRPDLSRYPGGMGHDARTTFVWDCGPQ